MQAGFQVASAVSGGSYTAENAAFKNRNAVQRQNSDTARHLFPGVELRKLLPCRGLCGVCAPSNPPVCKQLTRNGARLRPAWHAKCFSTGANGPPGTAATDKDTTTMVMKVQCCVCKRIRLGNRWYSPQGRIAPHDCISYGYCPECAADAAEKLRQEARDAAYPRASVA